MQMRHPRLFAFPVCSPEHMFCHQPPCGLTQLSSEALTMAEGGGMGGWRRLNGGVWRFPAFPTVAFVVIHWWLWEPPTLCKSVFASQVFVCAMCSQARDSVFFCTFSPEQSGAKGQSCINAGILFTLNHRIKICYFYINNVVYLLIILPYQDIRSHCSCCFLNE